MRRVILAIIHHAAQVLIWKGASSCSPDRAVSEGFLPATGQNKAGHTGVLFRVRCRTAIKIQQWSLFPDESEVLMSPFSQLSVTASEMEGGVRVVSLEELSTVRMMFARAAESRVR